MRDCRSFPQRPSSPCHGHPFGDIDSSGTTCGSAARSPKRRTAVAFGQGLLLSLAVVGTAMVDAATYTVGVGGGCSHSTIQSALDAAGAAGGPHEVRISRSATWTAQALTATTSGSVRIVGGFATCTQSTGDGIATVVSGSGGTQAPVLRINLPMTASTASIANLTFRDGDAIGSLVRGGGIQLTGVGTLTIADTVIQYNTANYGGGISAEGSTAAPARLVLQGGVLVLNNTARFDGGGIHLDKATLTMDEAGSTLFGNTAQGENNSGYGGGLLIRGTNVMAFANIGGEGIGGLAAITGNIARYGGGVAVVGDAPITTGGASELRLYSRSTTRPGAIDGNEASVAGGGIYLRSHEATVSGRNIPSVARLWRSAIRNNAAPDGPAVFLERHSQPQGSGIGSRIEIDFGTPISGAMACGTGSFCSRITGNISRTPAGQNMWGPALWSNAGAMQIGGAPVGEVNRGGVLFEGNTAGRLFDGVDCNINVTSAQITGNTLGREVVGGSCHVDLSDLTIAGNTMAQNAVLELSSPGFLGRSIIWQPGKTTRVGIGNPTVVEILTSERASLDAIGAQFVTAADPRFIDPAHADYGLRAASPAVDYAMAVSGAAVDAQGYPRDIDLPFNANAPRGPRDVGALERQALLPLVLNADFDASDLRLWVVLAGSWDGSQNASGAAGSGSMSYSGTGLTQPRVDLGRQCVHLPGPGRYLLNGRGRAGGNTIATRDYAVLAWEFRRDGAEQCNFGSPNRSGELTVGSGTSWGQAGTPAAIEVTTPDWTANSSISITLVAVDGGVTSPRSISAWFDGITLEVDAGDTIFANGFDG